MVSKVLRQIHMYLALFLTPWILMYTASTFVMNHRAWFHDLYGGPSPSPALEHEMPYEASFPDGASPKMKARQILLSLNLDGAFNVNRRAGDAALIIQRLDPVTPRRITYLPSQERLIVEKLVWESRAFLERMHRRRGYQHDYPLEDAWAFSVDFVIAAILIWALSGLWMWWELKVTRKPGALLVLGGFALFAFFLAAI